MYKNFEIYGLFLLLVVVLLIKPRVIYDLYNNILGRLILIGIVVFLTTNNITLGLLSALCLIIASNMFFIEGMTIGDDTDSSDSSNSSNKIQVNTHHEDKDKVGVDRQSIQEAVAAKSSDTLPISPETFTSSDNVRPNNSEKMHTRV